MWAPPHSKVIVPPPAIASARAWAVQEAGLPSPTTVGVSTAAGSRPSQAPGGGSVGPSLSLVFSVSPSVSAPVAVMVPAVLSVELAELSLALPSVMPRLEVPSVAAVEGPPVVAAVDGDVPLVGEVLRSLSPSASSPEQAAARSPIAAATPTSERLTCRPGIRLDPALDTSTDPAISTAISTPIDRESSSSDVESASAAPRPRARRSGGRRRRSAGGRATSAPPHRAWGLEPPRSGPRGGCARVDTRW